MGPSEEEVQDMLEKAQRTQHIVTFGGAHLNTLNTKKDVTPIKSIEEAFVQNKTKIGKWNKFESKSADGEELERPMEIHLEVERKGPATAILGDQLFVFGGINTRARTMDTFEVCDLSGNCQTEIKDMFEHHVDEKEREKREREGGAWFTGKDVKIKGRGAYSGGPGPLFAASAVAQGGEIYVMGGCHDTDGKEQNENLWKMHPQMHGEGHEVKYKFERWRPRHISVSVPQPLRSEVPRSSSWAVVTNTRRKLMCTIATQISGQPSLRPHSCQQMILLLAQLLTMHRQTPSTFTVVSCNQCGKRKIKKRSTTIKVEPARATSL
jgi:hypothetical protein